MKDEKRNRELLDMYGRARIGIDGTAGFALLGEDLQNGEAEFVDIEEPVDDCHNQIRAAACALGKLRKRLNLPELSHYLDDSHPMFC